LYESGVILRPGFSPSARRLGIAAAAGLVLLSLGYAITLIGGLLSLESPQQPIVGWYFTAMELLILLVAPFAVVLMVAVHAWAAPESKAYSLSAVVFMGLLAAVTSSVHFVILTVGAQIAAADPASSALFLSFRWPSVAYALDILAWDVFYALAMLFAAAVLRGGALAAAIRILMVTSGVLSLAGLSALVANDMRLRMIGVVGYAAILPVVALLLGVLFVRTRQPARDHLDVRSWSLQRAPPAATPRRATCHWRV
jgi:hypothetical protein